MNPFAIILRESLLIALFISFVFSNQSPYTTCDLLSVHSASVEISSDDACNCIEEEYQDNSGWLILALIIFSACLGVVLAIAFVVLGLCIMINRIWPSKILARVLEKKFRMVMVTGISIYPFITDFPHISFFSISWFILMLGFLIALPFRKQLKRIIIEHIKSNPRLLLTIIVIVALVFLITAAFTS